MCKVTLPSIEEQYGQRLGFRDHETKVTSLVRFVRKELSRADSILEGAKITVDAVIRMNSGALGRKRLGSCQHGQSVDHFLDSITRAWAALPKEEDWGSELIEVPDATGDKTAKKKR